MTESQKNRFTLFAYHKETQKIYPVVSLGVFGVARKHTLLDVHSPEADDGDAPLITVNDCDVEIIEPKEEISDQNDLYRELGKTVVQIDWVKIGERFELDFNYDGGGWEHLARAWRDNRAFGVYHHILMRFNKHFHWLDFLEGKGVSSNNEQSVNILEYLEKCNPITPIETMLRWRNIESEEDACIGCGGSGVKTYANTTTWRGGMGGQALTSDVCDKCWGSGNKHRPWANLKEITKKDLG
jgi:hypothetical protein